MSLTTFDVTALPDDPFFTGSGQRDPEEQGFPVALDGRGFVPDLSENLGYYHRAQRQSINLTNTQQAQSGGDQTQVPPEVWRRSIESWQTGAGQKRYDRDTSEPTRYLDSHNVDVWDQWRLSLLPGVDLLRPLAAGRVHLMTVGPNMLFAVVGQIGYWWTDLTTAPVIHDFGVNIRSACSDGTYLYLLDDFGLITRWSDPSTSVAFANISIVGYDATRTIIRHIKGYLVAGVSNFLFDFTAGTPVEIYQHPLQGWTYVDGCEGSGVGYVLGGQGDKWQVMAINIKADATTFDPPITAGPLADGEIALTIETYLNYLLVGTDQGWHFGTIDNNGGINFGRLVTTGTPVHCFEGQDRFVWYGMDGGPTTAGLGRADLSTFSGPLTPAYAPDLSTDVATGTVWDVVTFAGKRVFAVDGAGLYVESSSLAASGWLDQGAISMNTTDSKMGLYLDVHHEPLAGTVKVDLDYDDAGFAQVAINNTSGSISTGRIQMGRAFSTVKVRYNLLRDAADPTAGPVLGRTEVRALPISGKASEFRLPLILRAALQFNGVTQSRDVDADYDLLMDLVETKRPFVMRLAQRHYTVYANDFTWLPDHLTETGATFSGIYILILREVS